MNELMSLKKAKEIVEHSNIPHNSEPYQIERYWIALGFLKAYEQWQQVTEKLASAAKSYLLCDQECFDDSQGHGYEVQGILKEAIADYEKLKGKE